MNDETVGEAPFVESKADRRLRGANQSPNIQQLETLNTALSALGLCFVFSPFRLDQIFIQREEHDVKSRTASS